MLLDLIIRQDEDPPIFETGVIFWSASAAQYYNTATGQFVSNAAIREVIEPSIAGNAPAISRLAELVSSGQLSPADWLIQFQQQIKLEYLRQYALGYGGFNQMGSSEYGSIGRMLKDQYGFARNFMNDLGNLSEAQIRARMELYINSARQAYERANAKAQGVPANVPFWPGDGSSECGTNDKCRWRWNPILDSNGDLLYFEGYWELDPGVMEHCATCLERNTNSPFIINV